MANLLIKNMPEALRDKLQKTAKQHQRSMNQQAIKLLTDAMDAAKSLPKPMRIKTPLNNSFINRAKRQGRA